jgi:SLT domain-containing protein
MKEQGGKLKPAILGYLHGGDLDREEIALIKAYLKQWVDHPGWERGRNLTQLRRMVDHIDSREDISKAVWLAVSMGMDPL